MVAARADARHAQGRQQTELNNPIAICQSCESKTRGGGEAAAAADRGLDAVAVHVDDALVLARADAMLRVLILQVSQVPDTLIVGGGVGVDHGNFLGREHLENGAAWPHVKPQVAMFPAEDVGAEEAGTLLIVEIR